MWDGGGEVVVVFGGGVGVCGGVDGGGVGSGSNSVSGHSNNDTGSLYVSVNDVLHSVLSCSDQSTVS